MDDDFLGGRIPPDLETRCNVSTQRVESQQSLAFQLVADGLGAAIASWSSPNEADGKFVSVMTVAIHHSLKYVRCEVLNGEFPC